MAATAAAALPPSLARNSISRAIPETFGPHLSAGAFDLMRKTHHGGVVFRGGQWAQLRNIGPQVFNRRRDERGKRVLPEGFDQFI